MQEINRKGTEEDGFDECMLTSIQSCTIPHPHRAGLKTVEEELIKDDVR